MYGKHEKNLFWLKSYLSNTLQFVKVKEETTTGVQLITCGLSQSSTRRTN